MKNNTKDRDGELRKIRYTVLDGDLDELKNVVSLGVDVISSDALLYAAMAGDLDMVKYLVSVGCDINAYDRTSTTGRRVVYNAIQNGHLDVVKYLIKMGADLDHDFLAISLERAEKQFYHETAKFIKLCMKKDKLSKHLVKIMLKDV